MVEPRKVSQMQNPGLTFYIFKPMWVTLKHVFKKNQPEDWWLRRPCTLLYPYEKDEMGRTFRGQLSVRDGLCIGCGKCTYICPNECLEMVEVEDPESKAGKKRRPQAYIGRCLFCGFCQEKCPTGAFYLTEEYELASFTKEEMVLTPEMLDELVPEYRKDIELVLPDEYPALTMEKCIGCKLCAKKCPQGAITMVPVPGTEKVKADGTKGKPKEIPIFDYEKCVWCELCVTNCKPGALDFILAREAKAKNEEARRATGGAGQ